MTRLDHCIYVFLHISKSRQPNCNPCQFVQLLLCVCVLSILSSFVFKEHAPDKKNASLNLLVRRSCHLDINQALTWRNVINQLISKQSHSKQIRYVCILTSILSPFVSKEHAPEKQLYDGGRWKPSHTSRDPWGYGMDISNQTRLVALMERIARLENECNRLLF
jgi:hypothetical protein